MQPGGPSAGPPPPHGLARQMDGLNINSAPSQPFQSPGVCIFVCDSDDLIFVHFYWMDCLDDGI